MKEKAINLLKGFEQESLTLQTFQTECFSPHSPMMNLFSNYEGWLLAWQNVVKTMLRDKKQKAQRWQNAKSNFHHTGLIVVY